LLAVVYEQLLQLARARMAHLPPGQTLQPTALVHEAYLRLTDKSDITFAMYFRTAREAAPRDLALADIITQSAAVIISNHTEAQEHARAEEKLHQSEERFHAVANNISQLAWICDKLGNVIWYNQRWLDYTGLSFDAMKGWDWSKVQHPDHLDRVVARVKLSGARGRATLLQLARARMAHLPPGQTLQPTALVHEAYLRLTDKLIVSRPGTLLSHRQGWTPIPGPDGGKTATCDHGPSRQPGVGRIRCAVERGHAFLAQFGRIAHRLDRLSKRFLGWVKLAAAIIFLRTEAITTAT
jgi:PAS domain-containing protein